MHAHTPILNNPEKKKNSAEGFPSQSSHCWVSTSFSVVSLYWSAPQSSLRLYLAFCPLWITSPDLPLFEFALLTSLLSAPSKKLEEWLFYLHLCLFWLASISIPQHLNLPPSLSVPPSHVLYRRFLILSIFYPTSLSFLLLFSLGSPPGPLFADYKYMCAVTISVCPANEAETVWTVKRVCVWRMGVHVWSLMFCWLYIHWAKENEKKRAWQMEGQRDKDMGRWGSDGKESEQQLSHVRVRCGEAMLCEIKISTPE